MRQVTQIRVIVRERAEGCLGHEGCPGHWVKTGRALTEAWVSEDDFASYCAVQVAAGLTWATNGSRYVMVSS